MNLRSLTHRSPALMIHKRTDPVQTVSGCYERLPSIGWRRRWTAHVPMFRSPEWRSQEIGPPALIAAGRVKVPCKKESFLFPLNAGHTLAAASNTGVHSPREC